ncbi:MAG: GGDEF domain-containing protein [Candidatus Cloacimonetes bacterium]|nr:GGDEF domain-containing protein [Candidatus Cloacimonadota bacterium]
MAFDLAGMSQLKPEYVNEIRSLVHDFFKPDNRNRNQQIEKLIQTVSAQVKQNSLDDDFLASVAVFFDAAFEFIISQEEQNHSELYKFFRIINHLPILPNSRFYDEGLEILRPYFEKDTDSIKFFDRLQLLFVYSEISYEDAAQRMVEELLEQVDSSPLCFYVMYQLSRVGILGAHGETRSKMKLLLELTIRVWNIGGREATLFLLTSWLFTLSWFKSSKYYKALLYNLYEKIRGTESLNMARVGYELFLLDDKQVSPAERMRYYQDLIKISETILNSRQMHSLHFFAGNYLSGFNEQFHDSILSFKASNYYLHKCWERLIEISKYLRTHSDPKDYKLSMNYVEDKLLNLSNQTSLRNNSYVENLQMNFEKIEDLYREVGELSLTDPLSGLRNRRFMDNNLLPILALAARHNVPVCFSIIDIDYFKSVNDKYGHIAGDYILKTLGEMLSQTFRHSDIIVRYGGDEFLIVLFDTNPQYCEEMMNSFRKKVENRVFNYQRKQIKITVSIGAYCNSFQDNVKLKNLSGYIDKADVAMYEAKESGRNAVSVQT